MITECKKYTLMLEEERKILTETPYLIHNPNDLYHFAVKECRLDRYPNEHFLVIAVNAKGEIIGYQVTSIGSLSEAPVSPRNVFQFALLCNASGICLIHNHPSGDPTPSPGDINTTQRLREAGDLLEIPVLDHVIIGEGTYSSLKAIGKL